jgi:hypothetical protein
MLKRQAWIRSGAWDGFWMLSGAPIALALILSGPSQRLAFFFLVVLMETGHTLSPIILAWTHAGFRRLMLDHKAKFVLLPLAVFVAAILIGGITSLGFTAYESGPHHLFQMTGWDNPLPVLVWVYLVWNAYHFGMQNYGVLSIYRRKQTLLTAANKIVEPKPEQNSGGMRQCRIDLTFCLLMTCTAMAIAMPVWFMHWPGLQSICIVLSLTATSGMAWREIQKGMGLPRLIFILTDGFALALVWWNPLVGFAVYSVNHWLVAIGLSSHVSPFRPWVFAGAMFLIGSIGFLWLNPSQNGNILRAVPIVVCARVGLGFVHFLYDRWIWKFSNPAVRATIGNDLFGASAASAVNSSFLPAGVGISGAGQI